MADHHPIRKPAGLPPGARKSRQQGSEFGVAGDRRMIFISLTGIDDITTQSIDTMHRYEDGHPGRDLAC